MNSTKIIVLAFLLISPMAYSQKEHLIQIPATIVYDESRTEDVRLALPTDTLATAEFAMSIQYYDANGKRRRLYPKEAKEVRFSYEDREIRMVSVKHASRMKAENQSFLELITDGPMKLYTFYEDQRDSAPAPLSDPIHPDYMASPGLASDMFWDKGIERIWVLRKRGKGTAVYPKKLGFKKQMETFFEDCPVVLDSIKTRNLKREDLDRMVRIYNENCGK